MKIIITSHGKLCEGIVDSYNMIVGPTSDIVTLPFYGSLEEFRKQQNKIFEDFKNEEIIVLCDLLGGTPYNEFLRSRIENLFNGEIICGYNLGMLIELSMVAMDGETKLSSAIDIALETGKSSVRLAEIAVVTEDEDIEF